MHAKSRLKLPTGFLLLDLLGKKGVECNLGN